MLVRNMKKLTFPIIPFICSLLCLPQWAQQAEQSAYKNPQLPVEERVNDLVSRMTLQEKVSQLGHRSEEHTSELQSRFDLVCRLLLEKKNTTAKYPVDELPQQLRDKRFGQM